MSYKIEMNFKGHYKSGLVEAICVELLHYRSLSGIPLQLFTVINCSVIHYTSFYYTIKFNQI